MYRKLIKKISKNDTTKMEVIPLKQTYVEDVEYFVRTSYFCILF